jgi:hypothetical protein
MVKQPFPGRPLGAQPYSLRLFVPACSSVCHSASDLCFRQGDFATTICSGLDR